MTKNNDRWQCFTTLHADFDSKPKIGEEIVTLHISLEISPLKVGMSRIVALILMVYFLNSKIFVIVLQRITFRT